MCAECPQAVAVRAAAEILTRRLRVDDPGDVLRLRLVLDFFVAAHRHALEAWVALPGAPGRDALAAELRCVFDVVPDASDFPAEPRTAQAAGRGRSA
ncbi:hypothetical protein ACH4PU_04955 [Streptomyces sp. NPDC021100]|uniref:hypothetical protein n=1 Tax=Streptomyces sp. NPDC021100 TaxID=3365114 RepID=UPI0037BB149B